VPVSVTVDDAVTVAERVIVDAAVVRRILWFQVSATNTLPEVSTATPIGLLKSAAVPTPLVEPDVVPDELPPASVMTVRFG
jgi:hypothetical protein